MIGRSVKVMQRGRIAFSKESALRHREEMVNLLYPVGKSGNSLKERQHLVHNHPIYNFLHTYYRYSTDSLLKYSPGLLMVSNRLVGATQSDLDEGLLHDQYLVFDRKGGARYDIKELAGESKQSRKKLDTLKRNLQILKSSSQRQPLFSCYGLHEWAMLYKNNEKHQNALDTRLSQEQIDAVVESNPLRCTHYDAFRFFAKDAQGLNRLPLTRSMQVEKEQTACIHATMDLFKYAYILYPLCSSKLLRDTLKVALRARYIDMRASPYDVSAFEGCHEAIRVESEEGRKEYAREQEALLEISAPLRAQLTKIYDQVLFQVALSQED